MEGLTALTWQAFAQTDPSHSLQGALKRLAVDAPSHSASSPAVSGRSAQRLDGGNEHLAASVPPNSTGACSGYPEFPKKTD